MKRTASIDLDQLAQEWIYRVFDNEASES